MLGRLGLKGAYQAKAAGKNRYAFAEMPSPHDATGLTAEPANVQRASDDAGERRPSRR